MTRREAEQFEDAWQRAGRGAAVQGPYASLVETARQVADLASPLPLPSQHLAPGRQRFLAEAARLREESTQKGKERKRMTGAMKLATALTIAVLVFGLVFGVSQVAADRLPGDPLYAVKLAMEDVRVALTAKPEAKADLSLALIEERLDEVIALAQGGQVVGERVLDRTREQLRAALEEAAGAGNGATLQSLQRLETAIQQREARMAALADLAPGAEQAPLWQMVRAMERVRQEAQAGQQDPEGLRQRLRQGTPFEPTAPPELPLEQQEPNLGSSPGAGPQPAGGQGGATPIEMPAGGHGPGPQPAEPRGERHGPGLQLTEPPESGDGAGLQPTEPPMTPAGVGTQPTELPKTGESAGPQPTEPPKTGQDAGPQPAEPSGESDGAGPQPTEPPGQGFGPGPEPTDRPSGPGSTQETEPGRDSQPQRGKGGG
jgi:hypothetical protein